MLTGRIKDKNFNVLDDNLPVEIRLTDVQKRGVMYTATGYGHKIPTYHMVKYQNRWRRVYVSIHSNSGTMFIGKSLQSGLYVDIN